MARTKTTAVTAMLMTRPRPEPGWLPDWGPGDGGPRSGRIGASFGERGASPDGLKLFALVVRSRVQVARDDVFARDVSRVLPPPESESGFHEAVFRSSLRSCSCVIR